MRYETLIVDVIYKPTSSSVQEISDLISHIQGMVESYALMLKMSIRTQVVHTSIISLQNFSLTSRELLDTIWPFPHQLQTVTETVVSRPGDHQRSASIGQTLSLSD